MCMEKHRRLKTLVENTWIQGVVGSILLLSVFTEYFGYHHGLFALGIWHVAQLTPNILQGIGTHVARWRHRK